MGFGHRVYKNHDPRATVMRPACHDVLQELNIEDPLLDVAMELERIALSDPMIREETVPERRFLFWYHSESNWYSYFNVYRNFCTITYHWLDCTLE